MQCWICERGCHLQEGSIGACGKYTCQNDLIQECFPHLYLVTVPISAETMPVLHFHPRAKFLQISTTGCNFNCVGCISTVIAKEISPKSKALKALSPIQIVQKALELNCEGIAFLMNDPLASFLSFLEVCRLAKQHNLLTGCSSNGYFTPQSLEALTPYLDFINIGLKGLDDESYFHCGVKHVEPVLRTIRWCYSKGIHVEVATIHRKGREEDVKEIARFIASISPTIPLQIMRFIPIDEAKIEDEPSIRESEALYEELKGILPYVYLFNSPGSDAIHTYCPHCQALIFERDFYGPMGAKLRQIHHLKNDGTCDICGSKIEMVGIPSKAVFDEEGFEGGYPMTRALEIVEGTLVALGVQSQQEVIRCWEDLLANNGLKKLHIDIQNFEDYTATIRYLAHLIDKDDRAQKLIDYMKTIIDAIKAKTKNLMRYPTVYYVMGKPLFALEEGRLENQLVELAGGISLNKGHALDGRPGRKISASQFTLLNPDVIFISSFLDSPLEAFYEACEKENLHANAILHRQIFTHPYPCFDFGSPRWILGLMYIANMLHPELFHFEIEKEANYFYETFYHHAFDATLINRSFAKPYRTHRLAQ